MPINNRHRDETLICLHDHPEKITCSYTAGSSMLLVAAEADDNRPKERDEDMSIRILSMAAVLAAAEATRKESEKAAVQTQSQ